MSNIRFSDILNREPMRPVKTTSSAVALNTTGNVTLLSVTGTRGILKSLGFLITTGLTGSPVFTITIQVDGATAMVLSLFNGGLVIQAEMRALGQDLHDGAPTGVNEGAGFDLGSIPFNNSASVVLNRNTGGTAGAADFTVVHQVPV